MTTDLNADFWNTRYLKNDFGWDVGEISEPLKAYIDQLNDASLQILIPGAGNAYEAEYLLKKGFKHVYVCDLADEALKNLKQRCPEFPSNQLIRGDFFNKNQWSPPTSRQLKPFDLILEQTFFCAIHPALRQNYFKQMHALLKPEGRLVGVLFNDILNADKPPFGGSAEEYKGYFQNLFTVHTFETCYNSIQPRAERELFINLIKK